MDPASILEELGRRLGSTFGTRIGGPALVLSLTARVSCGDEGVPEACLPIGCGSPLTVEFVHEGDWPYGIYRIDADADGRQVSCLVTIPTTSNVGDWTWATLGRQMAAMRPVGSVVAARSAYDTIARVWASPKRIGGRDSRPGSAEASA